MKNDFGIEFLLTWILCLFGLHYWDSVADDIEIGELMRCRWCGKEEYAPYPPAIRHEWKDE